MEFKTWYLGAMLCLIAMPTATRAVGIDVEIRNRFRIFDYVASSPQQSAALFEKYAPVEADKTSVQWITRLINSGVVSPYKQSATGPWNEKAGKDDLPYSADFLDVPQQLMIRAALETNSSEKNQACEWFVNETRATTQACSKIFEPNEPVHTGSKITVFANHKELASTVVSPQVRVILGLGDSYSAGEGAPDVPVTWRSGIALELWPFHGGDRINSYVDLPTEWLSNRCNRSFYSYQNMVALRLAAQDKHAIVSFVHLACAGAEILDGVLAPQRVAPGAPGDCKGPSKRPRGRRDDVDLRCDVPYSQLRAVAKVLCPDHETAAPSSALTASIRDPFRGLAHGHEEGVHQDRWINELLICSKGPAHPVERVLMSIGGNDIGFGGLIAWGLLPRKSVVPILGEFAIAAVRKEGGAVCPTASGHDGEGPCKQLSAAQRLKELPSRYLALRLALASLTQVKDDAVVLSQYPNPLRDAEGRLCMNPAHQSDPNSWSALHVLLPVALRPERWQINLTEWEASNTESQVVLPLNRAVAAGATSNHWRLAAAGHAFEGHGWCVGEDGALLDSSEATNWKPYQATGRYIRSANDTFLTQWPGDVTPSRADGLNGTFHPNALGYAAIADSSLGALTEH